MNPIVAELVDRIQGGESELVTELWEKFRPLWTKWAKQTILCGYDTEDLYQQSYVILIDVLNRYDKELGVPFEGYYKWVLRSWRANQVRKKTEDLLTEGDTMEREFLDESICVEEEVIQKELWEKVWLCIGALPPKQQILMRGFYIENKSLGEIAVTLQMTYKGVETKKARILKQLRQKLG